jgi:mxaK protein
MALKHPLTVALVMVALASGAGVAREGARWWQVRHYNQALAAGDHARAAQYAGDAGRFAAAYALQQAGRFQDARVAYAVLEHSADARLRGAVLYNMGNTYLEQVVGIDLGKEADRALPLVELAKSSYRELLRIDAGHWDGRYNLERALQLVPDIGEQKVMNVEGRRSPVRTINSVDPEGALP